MTSNQLESLMAAAQIRKQNAIQLHEGIMDAAPNLEIKKLILENILPKEKKHANILENMASSFGKGMKDANSEKEAGKEGSSMKGKTRCFEFPIQQGTFVSRNERYCNFANDPSLLIGSCCWDNDTLQSLLQFDFDQIPRSYTVVKAHLLMDMIVNRTPWGGSSIQVFPIANPWCECFTSWDSRPKILPIYWTLHIPEDASGLCQFDISQYVRESLYGMRNYGLLMIGERPHAGCMAFKKTDFQQESVGPILRIEVR